MKAIWPAGRVTMPVTRWRVVCALADVMLTLVPTRRFSSVDLPTLGRPTIATAPARCVLTVSGASGKLIRLASGFLLCAAPAGALSLRTDAEIGDNALHLELLLVRFTSGGDHGILREGELVLLEVLLQERLGILAGGCGVDDIEQFTQQLARGGTRGLETAIEKYSPDYGFGR